MRWLSGAFRGTTQAVNTVAESGADDAPHADLIMHGAGNGCPVHDHGRRGSQRQGLPSMAGCSDMFATSWMVNINQRD
jgi:hypothetical protein